MCACGESLPGKFVRREQIPRSILPRSVSLKTGAVQRAGVEAQGPWVWPSSSQNFPVPHAPIYGVRGQTRASSQLSSSSSGWQVPNCLTKHFPVCSRCISLYATPNDGFSVTRLPHHRVTAPTQLSLCHKRSQLSEAVSGTSSNPRERESQGRIKCLIYEKERKGKI